MREIKFRVYSTVTGTFDYMSISDMLMFNPSKISRKAIDDDLTFEQFTCLKDHSKMDIFESDILKCSGDRFYGVVIFYHGCYLVDVYIEDRCVCRKTVTEYLASRRQAMKESCLVIGNIHQNPELLK